MLAGAGGDWTGAVWLAAVLWAIAASFVQALWRPGLRHGDWSAFVYVEVPRNDEEFDFFTRRENGPLLVGRAPTSGSGRRRGAHARRRPVFVQHRDHALVRRTSSPRATRRP